MLQILWNQFAYLGVYYAEESSEHKYIILVNGASLIIAFITISNSFLFVLLGMSNYVFAASIIYTFLLFITFVLNAKGKLFAARIYLCFISIIYVIVITISFGNQLRTHFFLLAEILLIYFAFPPKENTWKHFIVGLTFLLFLTFCLIHDSLKPFIIIPSEILSIRKIITDSIFGIIILGLSIYINSTFRKSELTALVEFEKSEKLLKNILPASVIKKLRENSDSIAERFENCTVLFSDIVGFTEMSKTMPATAVVELLNEIFSSFDDLAEKYNLEKIKTIGDAYMVAGGIPEDDSAHAEKVALFALEMLNVINHFKEKNLLPLEVRIGINSGDVVAGVIGKKKFIYDLWGDSVNTASRMESYGIPGQIQVSESTYKLLKDKFHFENRGNIEVKGIGIVTSYFLAGKFENAA